jgi:preprotein translocase subunit SecY
MNITTSRKPSNRLQISKVLVTLITLIIVGVAAVFYVSLKIEQHALGEHVLESERVVRELRSQNQDLTSRIASLSSRVALRSRIDSGFVALIPVQNTAIARLSPPAVATADGVLRTAANQSVIQ